MTERTPDDRNRPAETGLCGTPAWLAASVEWLRSVFPWLPQPLAQAAAPVEVQDLTLTPGMPGEVHIRTGARSPLSDLAKPLTDYFARSLREE